TKNLVFRGGGTPDETIIQGNGTGPVLTIAGGQDINTLIANMTFIGGGGTQGGGILVDGSSTPVFKNMILSANVVSGNGAGMAVLSGGADLSHMTISGNTAGGSGGALYAAAGSAVTVDQSILWSNGTVEIGSFGNVATTYSIVSGGADGTGNLSDDPLFVNGPALDFHLQWHSPAIDAGDPSGTPDPDGTVSDMGALYYDQTYQPPDPVTGLAYSIAPGQTLLSWDANSEADLVSYILYRGTASDALDSLALVLAPSTSYTDTTMDPGAIHYYQAGAVDTAGLISDLSAVLTVSFPILELSASDLSFGDVGTGDSLSVPLTLANNGSDTLFVDSIFVVDAASGFSVSLSQERTSVSLGDRLGSVIGLVPSLGQVSGFSASSGNGRDSSRDRSGSARTRTHSGKNGQPVSGTSLSRESVNIRLEVEVLPGESIGLDISFSREDTATVSTDLRVTSDDPLGNSDINIALTARSVAPVLSLSSAAIAFGNALSDSTFAVTVGNTGTDTLNISGLSTPAAVFSQTLSDSTLEPGSEALLSVTFSSSEPGYWAGDLTLTSDSYQSGTSPLALSAVMMPAQSHDFAGVLLGQTADHIFTYSNTGNTALTVSAVTIAPADYSVDPAGNITIGAGSSQELSVTFAPSVREAIAGSFVFTTPALEEDLTAGTLSGQGWALPTADFAATSISVVTSQGQDTAFDIELTNNGDYPLDYTTAVTADYAGWIWLTTSDLGQVFGTTASDINVQVVNTANLDPGTYNGTISFSTNTGSDPATLVANSYTVSVFLNLLADDSQLTDTTITVAAGNTPPIVFTDESGTPIGLTLDFVNSSGGTVTVQSVATQPPVDVSTPVSDPDGLITDPVYPSMYYELDTDIEGAFVTDIGLDYGSLAGISNPGALRLAKRPGNSGPAEPWVVISVAETDIDTAAREVVAKNQSSFSQWAMISNTSDNSFTDTQGPAWSAMSIIPSQPGALVEATVSVNLTDDTGIDGVTLYYMQGGGSGYTSVAMSGSAGAYSGTIPGSAVTQNGLIYYIAAQDVLGYATITDTAGVAVSFASGSLTTSTAGNSAYPAGLPLDAWRLISAPAVLTQTGLTQVLDELGTQDNALWRVFRYDGTSGTYKDNPVDLNTGESYWLYQKVEDNLALTAPAGETGNMSGTELTLATGWNFIGSPYPFSIPLVLDQVQFYGPLSYGLSGESWSSVVTELDPWNGYVVYNRTSSSQAITLDPIPGGGAAAARAMDLEDGWLMSIKATAGEYADIYNTFGALTGADDERDWHDNPEITAPGTSVSLSFVLPQEDEQYPVTADIRSLDQTLKVWDSRVRNNTAGAVTLSWSVEQELPPDYAVELIDLNTRITVDMLSTGKFSLGSIDSRYDRRLNVVSGDPDEVSRKVTEILSTIPEELSLNGNYPNPFNPVTTIRFGLPEPKKVSLSIVNMLGQEVAVLINGWRDIGRHEVRWQGMDSRGIPVASGVYFAVLRDSRQVRITKMMLLK
ncbi:MAG: choice-of-anchor D domain-containing protein, partial [Candidatus Neomarinimicrobiota bacterium]|nr:choice-of-anchor D domain-containing protein [Candidatus Neomarinimicrobiota bacterium]